MKIKDINFIIRLLRIDSYREMLSSFELDILLKKYLFDCELSLEMDKFASMVAQKLLDFNKPNPLFYREISELGFNNAVKNALKQNGFIYVYQLLSKTEEELLELRGIGLANMKNIKMVLGEYNLDFICNCNVCLSDLISSLPISFKAIEALNLFGVVTFGDLLNISFDVQHYLYYDGILLEIQMLVKNMNNRFQKLDPDLASTKCFEFSKGMIRSFNVFRINTMGQLLRMNVKNLCSIPGVGIKEREKILNIVHSYGYLFSDEEEKENDFSKQKMTSRCLRKDRRILG